MKKSIWQTLVISFIIAVFLYSNSLADSVIIQNNPSIQQEIAKLEYQFYQQEQMGEDEAMIEDIYQYKDKSTKGAFVYSLLLPGAGEYYAESKTKAAIFLGLEAAFWIGYFHYHGKAGDKEDEYKIYADQYWSEDDYLDWLSQYCNATSDRDPCISDDLTDTSYWTHHLPNTKNQEYYEMVGKYNQFVYGWEDTEYSPHSSPPFIDSLSAYREIYMDMRHDANKLFDKAKYAVMASLANHVLSAFDAAWTAKRYNQKADRFAQVNFKMRMVNYEDELVPKAFVTLRF